MPTTCICEDLYMRGQYYLNQRTPEFMRKAMESFEAAVQKDPLTLTRIQELLRRMSFKPS